MLIDPKVREALEWRGVDSVHALLKTGSGRSAAISLGPGFYTERSDAEEWLREKERDRLWIKIGTVFAVTTTIAAYAAVFALLSWVFPDRVMAGRRFLSARGRAVSGSGP
jgi:hypothetical protein